MARRISHAARQALLARIEQLPARANRFHFRTSRSRAGQKGRKRTVHRTLGDYMRLMLGWGVVAVVARAAAAFLAGGE